MFRPRSRRLLIALLGAPALQLLSSTFLPAYAGDAELSAADNSLILTSAGLVLLMTPGLAFFQGGCVQARNVLNTMAMSCVMMVYAPPAHMVWGGGFLGKDLDFAGGTVVYLSSGVSALLLAGLVSWRQQWTKSVRPPHDVTQILLGTGLLWFGWFGFKGGSQLAVQGAELPITTTHLSAAAGLVAWALVKNWRDGKPTAVGMAIGAVAGLVGVTPAAGFVTPGAGMATGAITGVV